jgi:AraC-like DNA-binding protein
MDNERPYLEDQLTITDLARQMTMSERSLSRLINAESGSHFNAFINGYRVAEAKTLLSNPEMDHLTMEGIAFEAGFFSRATFYAAFKKETSESPTSFKKRLQARV